MAYENPRPTSPEVGSSRADVANDNLTTLDYFVAGTDDEVTNRKSQTFKTLKGINDAGDQAISDFNQDASQALSDFDTTSMDAISDFNQDAAQAIANAGYAIKGSFEDGGTLEGRGDVLSYKGDPNDGYKNQGFYVWLGSYPYTETGSPGNAPDLTPPSNWQVAALGYTKQSGVIQLFAKELTTPYTIPSGLNGLMLGATVEATGNITVPMDSGLLVLGVEQ